MTAVGLSVEYGRPADRAGRAWPFALKRNGEARA